MQHFSITQTWRDILSLVGSLFLLIFGTSALFSEHTAYALTLYGFAAISLGNFLLYKKTGHWQRYRIVVMTLYSVLMLFLVVGGGENSTGILWCYAYPLLVFPLTGHRVGKWLIGAITACAIAAIYLPEQVGAVYAYPMDFRHRFAGSVLFVSMMGYILERARARAIEKTQVAMELLRYHASHDELTGTCNRRGIKQKVQLELHRVIRDRTEMSLVLCDIDLFKRINDAHGHDIGDMALKQVARILTETVRVTDSVGRWGGEEFLILLPNTSLQKGYQLIERVRKQVARQTLIFGDVSLNISISCGICSTRFFSSFDDLIKAADQSLYQAKAEGRNCTRPTLARTA
jgi:diguanylate cyclase (GGDEF)-like protein